MSRISGVRKDAAAAAARLLQYRRRNPAEPRLFWPESIVKSAGWLAGRPARPPLVFNVSPSLRGG